MALRARLVVPAEAPQAWPWHTALWVALPGSTFITGERRLEAENYLSSGYGLRIAFAARKTGWCTVESKATVWQPSRLKGIQVSRGVGTPFLAATQVFDVRPVPRKWLAIERTPKSADRFATEGTILVTCSGSVGRAMLAHKPHAETLISHDLLRVAPKDPKWWGWLFAYLRAPHARLMMTSAQYGHMIKHLEPAHLDAMPIPHLKSSLLEWFTAQATELLRLRNKAHDLVKEAEEKYAAQFAPPAVSAKKVTEGFSMRASSLFELRRRLEASYFHPLPRAIDRTLEAGASKMEPLDQLVQDVRVPGRFKHIYGSDGVPYLDSADILEVCSDVTKFVLSLDENDRKEYLVKPNWLLLPCSGQVYGNLAEVVLATEWHVGKVISNHVLRVIPKEHSGIRIGYLQCVLGHPTLGRPRVTRLAFGSSVPELSPDDVKAVLVPRLGSEIETSVAERMEAAARLRSDADLLETEILERAESLIAGFLAGDVSSVVLAD